MKKFFVILLSLVLCASVGSTVFATTVDFIFTGVSPGSIGKFHFGDLGDKYVYYGEYDFQIDFDQTGPEGYVATSGFCVEDAAYYTEVAEPPATRALRTGIDALRQYSQVLLVLAEGRNIEQARMQLRTLGAMTAGTLAMIPGGQGPAAMILPVLEALGPLMDAAAKAQNFKEMIRLVSAANPQFARLVLALQAATPDMFNTLTRSAARMAPTENPEMGAMIVAQINGYRKALSSYVVLLEELELIHVDIVNALKAAEDEPLSLAVAVNRAEQLNNQANALRQVLVTLRRGVAP